MSAPASPRRRHDPGPSGGTRTLDAASSISVANAIFSGGTTTLNGNYNVAGTTTVNGGTATLTGTLSNLGNALVISTGTLSLNTSNASVTTLTQSSGLQSGTGTLTVSGLSTFIEGRESSARTTIALRWCSVHLRLLPWMAGGPCG